MELEEWTEAPRDIEAAWLLDDDPSDPAPPWVDAYEF